MEKFIEEERFIRYKDESEKFIKRFKNTDFFYNKKFLGVKFHIEKANIFFLMKHEIYNKRKRKRTKVYKS